MAGTGKHGTKMNDSSKLDEILVLVRKIPGMEIKIAQMELSLSEVKSVQDNHGSRIVENEKALNFFNTDMESMKEKVEQAEKVSQSAGDHMFFIEALKDKMKELNKMIINLEAYSRRENLIFEGIPETKDESCLDKVFDIMINVFKVPEAAHFRVDRCHRLHGNVFKPDDPRPIIVRFNYHPDRLKILKNRRNLKGTKYVLREDHPGIIDSRGRALAPVLRAARNTDKYAAVYGDELVYKKKRYSWGNLPKEFELGECGSKTVGKFHCFSGRSSVFSNFHYSDFEKEGIRFNTNEQYYQYKKALYFDRKDVAARVLLEDEPIIQKRIGDSVATNKDWEQGPAQKAMTDGLYEKFEQNPKLNAKLLEINTKGQQFVECMPGDTFWGNGIHISQDAKIGDTKAWRGPNMLGQCLTEVAGKLAKMN